MDELRSQAILLVGRTVLAGFAGTALLTVALSFAPLAALNAGGTASLALSLFLLRRSTDIGNGDPQSRALRSALSFQRSRTAHQPKPDFINEILMDTYLGFARLAAGGAVAFFAAALLGSTLL